MYSRIIVPVDGSDIAEQVLPHVEALSKAFGAQVTVLWVTPPVDTVAGVPVASEEHWQEEDDALAKPYLQRIEEQLRAGGVQPSVERARGVPAEVIVATAKASGADLITMTTHGRSGIKRLVLGSVAEGVITRAECPVLMVRAK
jgi:nucleotide-binding universal stress UspA family protein